MGDSEPGGPAGLVGVDEPLGLPDVLKRLGRAVDLSNQVKRCKMERRRERSQFGLDPMPINDKKDDIKYGSRSRRRGGNIRTATWQDRLPSRQNPSFYFHYTSLFLFTPMYDQRLYMTRQVVYLVERATR